MEKKHCGKMCQYTGSWKEDATAKNIISVNNKEKNSGIRELNHLNYVKNILWNWNQKSTKIFQVYTSCKSEFTYWQRYRGSV